MEVLMQAHALELERQGRHMLRGVSLDLQRGELLGVIGPNGAGKSTLLRLLAGIERPDKGGVSLQGVELKALGAAHCARHIAWLEQRPQLRWPLPVEQVVALGRLPFRHIDSDAEAEAAIERALQLTGTLAWRKRLFNELSEGEKLLVNLARILAVNSEVLLADEPTAALDPRHQIRIMELLQQRAAAGTAVVVVLHDLALAWRYCERLLLLHEGKVLAIGKPAEVLQESILSSCYGLPAQVDTASRHVRFSADAASPSAPNC